MQEVISPKIILNEEYIDLRKYPDNSINSKKSNTGTHTSKRDRTPRTTNLRSEGLRLEKELINCGLKKLVTSYNATAANANMHHRQQINVNKKMRPKEKTLFDPRFHRFVVPEQKQGLKSQSEISMMAKKIEVDQTCTSTPLFKSKKTTSIEVDCGKNQYEPKNKCTMTKCDADKNIEGHILKPSKISDATRRRSKSRDRKQKELKTKSPYNKEYVINNQYVDPRLCEKYSVLKMPWKRTWTIPVFSRRSTNLDGNKDYENIDRQTYLYDDGTEIDSVYVDEHQKVFEKAIQSHCMAILFLGGSICGMLLISLLIWFVFGNDFFHLFLTPRQTEEGNFKHFAKYIGGGFIYVITTVFRSIGKVLTTPTQHVYQSPPENYRWPAMQQ